MVCDPTCSECGGLGFWLKSEDTQVECTKVYVRKLGARLGPDIQSVKSVPESPLFVPGDELIDKTDSNCFIKARWEILLGHMKWAFICKFNLVGLERFYFQTVTDQRLLNVWLSNEAYQAKARKKREESDTYNSLPDLIGEMYSLVIIRIGFLGYKNQAMPGVLKEALLLRQGLNLPTWIVEEPENPFEMGHLAWNPEVADYIKRRFEVLPIQGGTATPAPAPTPFPSDAGMHVEAAQTVRERTRMVQPEPPMFDLLEGANGGKKRYNTKRRGGDS